MNRRRPPPSAAAIVAALRGLLRGERPKAAARATLKAFEDLGALGSPRGAALRALARRHLDALGELAAGEDAATRHLAAFALGASGDRRAVAPLMALLVRQRDFFDHDFGYTALGALGPVAQPALYRVARAGRGAEVLQAVQALGQSGPGAVPWLRKLGAAGVRPRHFYVAYFNQHDPRGLPDLEPGLRASNVRTRRDALEAADALLGLEAEGDRPFLRAADRARWGRLLLPLARRGELDAISCLGWLRHEPGFDVVARATSQRSDFPATVAIEALARYRSPRAREILVKRMTGARPELACKAAVELATDPGVDRALRLRAREAMLDGVLALDGSFAWCDAASALGSTAAGRRALLARARAGSRADRARVLRALRWASEMKGRF